MKLLLVASSSGGHVYPAFTLGKYLKEKGEEVHYLGIRGEIEEKILPSESLILLPLPKSFRKSLAHPSKTRKCFFKADEILREFDAVVGFGGFITLFVSRLPSLKQRFFYLHEANVDFGDSNKYALSRCQSAFTTFLPTDSARYRDRIVLSGNPVTDSVERSKGRGEFISFIFGSLGSATLMETVMSYLKRQNRREKFLLITSERYYHKAVEVLGEKQNVTLRAVTDKNELYSASRVIFCRGGASTLAEIITAGVNCVCIPSPYVKHHHQERNAQYLAEQHLIAVVGEEEFTPERIDHLVDYYARKDFPKMELCNQRGFLPQHPCLTMYMKIRNDYDQRKLR